MTMDIEARVSPAVSLSTYAPHDLHASRTTHELFITKIIPSSFRGKPTQRT